MSYNIFGDAYVERNISQLDNVEIQRMFGQAVQQDLQENKYLRKEIQRLKERLFVSKQELNISRSNLLERDEAIENLVNRSLEAEESKKTTMHDIERENAMLLQTIQKQDRSMIELNKELQRFQEKSINLKKELFEVKKEKGLDEKSTKLKADNQALKKEVMRLKAELPKNGHNVAFPASYGESQVIHELQEEMEELRADHTRRKGEVMDLRRQLVKAQEDGVNNEELRVELEQTLKELKEYKQSVKSHDIAQANEELEVKSSLIQRLREDLRKKESEFSKTFNQSMVKANEDVAKVKEEMALKIEKLYDEIEEKNKLEQENDKLSREILKLKGELVSMKYQQRANLSETDQILLQEQDELLRVVESIKKELDAVEEKQNEGGNSGFSDAVKSKMEMEMQRLREELEITKRQQNAERENYKFLMHLDGRKEDEKMQQLIKDKDTRIHALISEVDKLQCFGDESLLDMQNEISVLKREATRLMEEQKEKDEKINALQKQVEEKGFNKDLNEIEEKMVALEKQHLSQIAKLNDTIRNLEKSKSSSAPLPSLEPDVQSKLDDLQKKNDFLMQENRDLTNYLSRAGQKLKKYEEQKDYYREMKKESESLRLELSDIEKHLNASAEEENVILRKQVQDLLLLAGDSKLSSPLTLQKTISASTLGSQQKDWKMMSYGSDDEELKDSEFVVPLKVQPVPSLATVDFSRTSSAPRMQNKLQNNSERKVSEVQANPAPPMESVSFKRTSSFKKMKNMIRGRFT